MMCQVPPFQQRSEGEGEAGGFVNEVNGVTDDKGVIEGAVCCQWGEICNNLGRSPQALPRTKSLETNKIVVSAGVLPGRLTIDFFSSFPSG